MLLFISGPELLEPKGNRDHGGGVLDSPNHKPTVVNGHESTEKNEELNNHQLNNGSLCSSSDLPLEQEASGSIGSSSCSMMTTSVAKSDEKQHIQLLCDTMRKQIISRAFYGWLAYCRHLKTVRTHLADLVNPTIMRPDKPCDAGGGITSDLWRTIHNPKGQITIEPSEFYRLIYYGGVEHSIRSQVWPYLLEHYRFGDTDEEKRKHDTEMRQKYEMIMSDWLAVEAIVRQRDKEIVAANLAKLSVESKNETFDEKPTLRACQSSSNEVFDDFSLTDSRKSSVPSEVAQANDESNKSEPPISGEATQLDANERPNSATGRKQLIRHRQVESVASLSGQASSMQNIFVTNPSVDQNINNSIDVQPSGGEDDSSRLPVNSTESAGSQCVSPASSNGGIYTVRRF